MGPVGFHVADGGLVCSDCLQAGEVLVPAHLGTLRALHQSLLLPFDRLDRLVMGPQSLAEASRLVARFTRFHVGLELKSEKFLEEMLHPSAASHLG